MSLDIPEPEETEMNMTPMIDVVFQLIVFFLLSLKFKSVDRRFDSQLPKSVGILPPPVYVEIPTIPVKLFRIDEAPAEPWTKVRIGNRDTFRLPPVGQPEERQQAVDRIAEGIRESWAARSFAPDVKGEIRTPGPKGMAVPHGDVVAILDAFVQADLKDVTFRGKLSPLPPGYQRR